MRIQSLKDGQHFMNKFRFFLLVFIPLLASLLPVQAASSRRDPLAGIAEPPSRALADGGQAWQSSPRLAGVGLEQEFDQVSSLLGPGRLVFESPKGAEQRQSLYEWETISGLLHVGFDESHRTIFVGLTSEKKIPSLAGVLLNKDTLSSVQTKLGKADQTLGPELVEGGQAFTVVYLAGPQRLCEVHFVSTLNLDATTLPSPDELDELLADCPVERVCLQKHLPN